LFYPTTPQYSADATITYYTTPDSLAWVVGTLLTPERKALVMQEIRSAYQQYHAELWASLQPVLEGTLGDGWVVIEQDLPAAIRRRGPQLEALGTRYEEEILNEELLPLAKREIWPIVQQHAEPVMETIGLELWERVSLWRFGWRAAYDRSPLPDRNLVEHEWQRFVRVEALPILSKHSGEMIEVVRSVIQDASRNEAVQAGIRDSLSRVATDPEFQQLVYDIFEEVFILNPRLREVLQRRWTGPESQQALQLVSDRLEPTIRRVGDLLFGTFDQGITPEFASVLRTTILAKDQRWFLLEPNPGGKPLGRGQPVFTAQLASERRVKPTSSPQATPTAPPGIRGKQASGGG
jgi:hypothetical protein